jgi:3-oxoadipate enol-lactonase
VLIHSLAMDGTFWHSLIRHLDRDTAILVYDCRGHGRSGKPHGPYTVEHFAGDLADLMNHVGWDRAMVAGASMGGCIALAFAAAYPVRCTALGLIDTTAWYGPEAPRQWVERGEKAAQGGMAALVTFQTTRWFGDAFRERNPAIVQQCVDVFIANDVPAYVETCRMLGACDLRTALPGLNMPTAVIVGEEDYATPIAMAEAMSNGIKGSTLTILQGGRHLTPLEMPERIAADLNDLMLRGTPQ